MTPELKVGMNSEHHDILDQLVAGFITDTGKTPSNATVMDLIIWSHSKTTEEYLALNKIEEIR